MNSGIRHPALVFSLMMSMARTITRIRTTTVVTLLAVPASVLVSVPASAAPILVYGCVNQNYLVPTGTVVTADYTTCIADITQPEVDVYDAAGTWLAMETPTGSLPSVSFTTDETFHDLYANTSVAQTSPFTAQIHVFFFSCGTDPLAYTTNVMDPSYNSSYVTFSNTMPTTDLCSQSLPSSTPGPAPILQQFGMPQSGTCEDAVPKSLGLDAFTNAGWSPSWAQWMNGGKGGAVCTRTLVYSDSESKWIVG